MRTLLLAAVSLLLSTAAASAQTTPATKPIQPVVVVAPSLDVNDTPLGQLENDEMQTNIGGTWDWVDDADQNPSHGTVKTPWYSGLHLPGLGH